MKKIFILLIIFYNFIVLSISFAQVNHEGITDKEIYISQFGPLTGPGAVWSPVVWGAGFAFDLVNQEGGIHGRKIVYRPFDDGYDPVRTQSGVRKLQEKYNIFAWVGGVGTETANSVKDYLMDNKIPWFSPLSGSKIFSEPPLKYLFTAYALYSLETKILCKYAIKTMKKSRIAMVYQNDRYGLEGLEGALYTVKKYNLSLVAQIPVDSKATKLDIIAHTLQEAHADTVLVFTTPFAAIRLLKAARAIQFTPQWMGGIAYSDYAKLYKISQGMWTNMITTQQMDYSNTALIKKYKAAHKKLSHKSCDWSTFFHGGISFTEPVIEVLKRCGRNLDRERFVYEMERLKNFKGIGNPFSFKPFNPKDIDCRRGTHDLYLIQCMDQGVPKKLTDWIRID